MPSSSRRGRLRALPPQDAPTLERLVLTLSPEERAAVDEAMELAGRMLGATSPRGQRLEALCQEYLGAFPPPELAGPPRLPEVVFPCEERPSAAEARAWLEQEYERWAGLYHQEPVAAPDPKVGDLDRARRIGARLGELAAMQRNWDELVGHLGYIIVSLGLWRDLGFADVGHYASERLSMSERAFEQRIWLERRLWELPDLRQAMRDGRIGYAQARVIATCDEDEVAAWIEKAQHTTVIALQRAVEADRDAQLCARREEWNRTNPCPSHHLRGIHMGYVRVRGRAPDRLVWELGEVE